MPFTFAHPALVLPFCAKHRRLSCTGLVMGSIAPDFEYFFRMTKGDTYYSHTWPSLLYFNLPVAFLLAFIFHDVVRGPLLANLPLPVSGRFAVSGQFNWRRYCRRHPGTVVYSILLGAATHLLWDALTHASANYLYYRQHQLLWFGSWQHHSIIYTMVHSLHSLAGLVVLFRAFARMPLHPFDARAQKPGVFWLRIGALTLVVVLCRLWLGNSPGVGDVAVSVMAAFFLALAVGAYWTGRTQKQDLPTGRAGKMQS